MGKRTSIAPTYDSRETGPRYHVTYRVADRTIQSEHRIVDPFGRFTVYVGWRDLLRALLHRVLVVDVLVGADLEVIEDVFELDANYLGTNCTRRDEFNAALFSGNLAEFTGPSRPLSPTWRKDSAMPSADETNIITWAQMKALEDLRREQRARAAERRAAEARDRREWIESVRRCLGLVTEVHECRTWQIAEDWWAWACVRSRCPYADWRYSANFAPSKGRVRAQASAHSRGFLPPAPETAPGAGLDLTGFLEPR